MMNAHRITGIRGTAAGGLLAVGSIMVAGLLVVPSVAPSPRTVQVRAMQLVDTADSPPGEGAGIRFRRHRCPDSAASIRGCRRQALFATLGTAVNFTELFSAVSGA